MFAIDEFFIANTSWSQRWNERKLESKNYATNDRAWKFWRGATWRSRQPISRWLKFTSFA